MARRGTARSRSACGAALRAARIGRARGRGGRRAAGGAARGAGRAARRWRTVAIAGLSAALVLLALRLELRVNDRQLVVRWGAPEPAPAPAVIVRREVVPSSDFDDRLARMSALIRALAESADVAD